MSVNWVSIYSSKYIHKVEIVKAVLLDNNIDSVIVNKQDSVYLLGEIELHVHLNYLLEAKQILNKEKFE
jgi:hypothetical protein